MKKYFIVILFLLSGTTFAACPIDGTACVADMDINLPSTLQNNNSQTLFQSNPDAWKFIGTPDITSQPAIYEKAKPSRTFGPTQQDYGYNASCQFGICRNTGTPRSILNFE